MAAFPNREALNLLYKILSFKNKCMTYNLHAIVLQGKNRHYCEVTVIELKRSISVSAAGSRHYDGHERSHGMSASAGAGFQ